MQLFRGECEGCEEYVLSRGCGQHDDGERVCRFLRWGGWGGGGRQKENRWQQKKKKKKIQESWGKLACISRGALG